jgi:hypothetical protein
MRICLDCAVHRSAICFFSLFVRGVSAQHRERVVGRGTGCRSVLLRCVAGDSRIAQPSNRFILHMRISNEAEFSQRQQ